MVVAGPRYPLADLQRAARAMDLHVLARRLGLTHGTVRNASVAGLTDRQADHWAVRLGLHPAHVWRGWQDDAPDDDELDELQRERSERARRSARARKRAAS